MSGQIPFTPRAKKVLELSLREALSLGHNYIGTEHILLGLVRENEGVAARILLDFDADSEKIRNEVIRMLSSRARRTAAPGLKQQLEQVTDIDLLRASADEKCGLKEQAIEDRQFERAALLRDEELAIRTRIKELEEAADSHEYSLEQPGIVVMRAVAVGDGVIAIDPESLTDIPDPFEFGEVVEVIIRRVAR
jgi:ATP-dependent Clp protease ATP-binding subunit ClpA